METRESIIDRINSYAFDRVIRITWCYSYIYFGQAVGGDAMGFPSGVLIINFLLCLIPIGLV
jgi:hypothetical protein